MEILFDSSIIIKLVYILNQYIFFFSEITNIFDITKSGEKSENFSKNRTLFANFSDLLIFSSRLELES